MHNIKELIEDFSFRDELAQATEFKEEIKSGMDAFGLNALDFEEEMPTPGEAVPAPLQPDPIDEHYDAEANAGSLVHTLTAVDSLVLSFAVHAKCRKNAGGAKILKKMKLALAKELANDELSEYEKTLIARFKEYKSNLQLLSGEVVPNQSEIDRLIQTAIPYCEETKFKMGAGSAFWINYVGSLAGRLTKILTL